MLDVIALRLSFETGSLIFGVFTLCYVSNLIILGSHNKQKEEHNDSKGYYAAKMKV